ncbi:MAG: 3-alpha,7-alpha,12-alpha-trihydroxy-5-beta-cholest-24-enoyl-CoA hydratase [Alphaproteobacteria bacterium]|nr:3-alpha,7-alpha,12-alpha-trihydroxy-5-beta-cholest-24-enoyl-CoA hydratase [Alphaproteobacteria bacterium]
MTVNYQALPSVRIRPRTRYYNAKDTMLYALGLGLGADPMDEGELKFVNNRGLQALPTLATVLTFDDEWALNVGLDLTKVLHGEQRLRLVRPLETEGEIAFAGRVAAVYDKGAGRGALVLMETAIADAGTWEPIGTLESVIFVRGDGGFGGDPGGPPALPAPPARKPDATIDRPTLPRQALIYRLNGDWNPLHSDPKFAKRAGFDRPILHGLCTYGIAGAAVVAVAAKGDPRRLRRFDARFLSPVFPGETVRTEIWHAGGKVHFQARVVERDVVVLGHGLAEVLS